MKKSGRGIMGKVFGLSGVTLLSRILGLLRVRLEAEVIGGGAVASAWYLAFSFPNLLRRLFGEGALGNALMPIVAELESKYGRDHARGALAVVFPCLGILLGIIVVLCSAAALLVGNLDMNYRVRLVCTLTPLLMPYAIFICLTGVMTAVVNYAGSFLKAAFYSLSMNIFLVGGLVWGWASHAGASPDDLEQFLIVLSILFLVSGVVQSLLMCLQLKAVGFAPDFSTWKEHTGVLKKLFRLALPGFIGASALQISFLIDRNLAFYVNEQGVAALTFVDRLIDLPIGLFAVAMGQVFMARMSSFAASGQMDELKKDLNYGLRQVWFLALPLGAGIIFFHELLLKVICLGGSYTMSDLDAARTVALFYGCGIPFFCALKILQPAFYARKDMKTPLYCSLAAIGSNVVLSVALINPLAQGGIALATSVSSLLQCVLLTKALKKSGISVEISSVLSSLLRGLLASAGAGFGTRFLLDRFYTGSGRLWDFCALCAVGMVFAVLYLAISLLCRSRETGELLGRFRKKNA